MKKTEQELFEILKNATKENPIFVDITTRVDDNSYEGWLNHRIVDNWRGIAACTGLKKYLYEDGDREICPVFVAIEDGKQLSPKHFEGERIMKSSYGITGTSGYYDINQILPTTSELLLQYHEMKDSITVNISCCDFYEKMGKYGIPEIKNTKREFKNIEGIHSVKEGEKWMLENHPAQYMGCTISASNGDFKCSAVPCPEYPEGRYLTRKDRELYAMEEADRLGVQVGKFDYSLADKELKKQKNIERD